MSDTEEPDAEYDEVEKILFVGGGDAGLMSALILKQANPATEVTIVDDITEDTPAVGKSTISYILHTFHEVLEIDMARFISEVKPIWKGSVYFKDWCECDPFHVPFDAASLQPSEPGNERFETVYHRYETDNFRTLGGQIVEEQLSPFSQNGNLYRQVAYHLSTDRLNRFLREVCRERDIDLVDDEITEVDTTNNRINRVASDTTQYEADLYVDATGFDRVLMGALNNEFEEYDFPLDSALVAQTELPLSEVVPGTVITSGPHGWFWQIDTYDCRDLGYVYSSAHVSDTDAITEFVEGTDESFSESDIRQYEFDSGHYGRAWLNNCVAVGNALGFVEPLQSTALSVNAMLTEKLADLIADHNGTNHAGVRRLYNRTVNRLWKNVYDFISIHYRYNSLDGEFWSEMRSVNDESDLSRYVDNFRENGFSSFDEFGGRPATNLSGNGRPDSSLRGFDQYLFYHVLRSMGINSDFFETLDVSVGSDARENVERQEAEMADRADGLLTCEEFYEQSSL
jgi:tryptophan halogenase